MDNSIKYQLLGNMQLNNQTVLFLTIQFSINQLFVHGLKIKLLFFTHR